MEKLQRRSDGIAETLSGLFAVEPKRFSGKDEHFRWFDFRRTAVSDVVRVRWPIDDKIAVITASVATFMLSKGYAKNISDKDLNDWNEAIDELELDAPNPAPVPIQEEDQSDLLSIDDGKPKQEPAQEATGTQSQPQATQAPANGTTAAEGLDNGGNGTAAPQGTATGGTPAVDGGEGNEKPVTEQEKLQEGEESSEEGDGSEEGETEESEEGSEGATTKPKGKKKATKGLI